MGWGPWCSLLCLSTKLCYAPSKWLHFQERTAWLDSISTGYHDDDKWVLNFQIYTFPHREITA